MPEQEIRELERTFRDKLLPLKIYLFGSYTDGNYTDDSDLDFFIVVRDDVSDLAAEITKAYKAIREIKSHPVDILVSKESHFEKRKYRPSLENEVYKHGVLLYDANIPFDVSADPFYSDGNIRYLENIVLDIRSGKANFSEHELEDVDK